MGEKLRYTCYLASAIEHSKEINEGKKEDWKSVLKKELTREDIGIYDPVEREAQKTGKAAGEHVKYVVGLKQGGHWNRFLDEMRKIWFGNIKPASGHIIDIFTFLRNRKMVDGNEKRDLDFFADYEAVLRSDFIFAYMEKNVKTIGTVCEIHTCWLFKIPVYLILPDQLKADANSTLISLVLESGGEIFYSVNEAIKFAKEKYNIK